MLNILYGFVVPIGLSLSMLGMGLTLSTRDFAAVVAQPRAMAVGMVGQLLLLPAGACLVAIVFPLDPAIAAGLIILGACPGGITSNSLVYLARADAALSVALTSVSSLLAGITMPLTVMFAFDTVLGLTAQGIKLPFRSTAVQILLITAVPVIAGMSLRGLAPSLTSWLEPALRRFTVVLLAVIMAGALVLEFDFFSRNLPVAGPLSLLLCAGMMLVGWALSRVAGLGRPQAFSVATEVGLQNGALGAFVALTLLHEPKFVVVPSIYTIVMLLVGSAFVVLYRHGTARQALAATAPAARERAERPAGW